MADIGEQMSRALETKLYYKKSTREFCAWTAFTDARFKFSSHFGNYNRFVKLHRLVDLKKLEQAWARARADVERLARTISSARKMGYDPKQPGTSVAEDLAEELMLGLGCQVILEDETHKKSDMEPKGIGVMPIGMGTDKTWHGTPDMRVHLVLNLNVIVQEEQEEEENESDAEEQAENTATGNEDKVRATREGEDDQESMDDSHQQDAEAQQNEEANTTSNKQ